MLNKLSTYGIRGVSLSLLSDYLRNRTQYVHIQNQKSSNTFIEYGVPQGSILGLLLFLIYINDIAYFKDVNILSFADDTTICMSSSSTTKLFKDANDNMNALFTWFSANKLFLNARKTKYMIISPPNVKLDTSSLSIHVGDNEIERVGTNYNDKFIKFLGICLDENLTWKYHIHNIATKVSRSLFAIKQLKRVLPYACLRNLYYALIHPHLIYGLIIWGNANKAHLKQIITIQKRAIRTIHNATYNSHTEPLFKSSGILNITDLYEYQTLLFLHDYDHGVLPSTFKGTFKRNTEMSSIQPTRQFNKFYLHKVKSKFVDKLPAFAYPVIWNKWLNNIDIRKSKFTLKSNIKHAILSTYLSHVTCTNYRCRDCYP